MTTLRLLGPDDAEAFAAHMGRSFAESGTDGDPKASVRSRNDPPDPVEIAARARERWIRPVTECHWARAFGVIEGDVVRGHLDLAGAPIAAALHRARLGVGLERPFRRRGHGAALFALAEAWAREAGISWLDLGVFSDNAPARALYRARGFVETGTVVDAFRIDGESVTDVSMSLRLQR